MPKVQFSVGHGNETMTKYTATFADGSTKELKNSKRQYAVAWRVKVEVNTAKGSHINTHDGFARDETAARKAMQSETAYIRNKRWNPRGGRVFNEEIVPAVVG